MAFWKRIYEWLAIGWLYKKITKLLDKIDDYIDEHNPFMADDCIPGSYSKQGSRRTYANNHHNDDDFDDYTHEDIDDFDIDDDYDYDY